MRKGIRERSKEFLEHFLLEKSQQCLNKCYRKGCQLFAAHMEEEPKDKVPNIEDHAVLKEFEDLFHEVP
jgi:hypothetical protein